MTVVVGFVPTGLGRAALGAAVEEAALRRSDLVVVNCATGAAYADAALASDDELAEAVRLAADAGVAARVHQDTHSQSPAECVVRQAADTGAELLVIGMRHRSRTGKFLLGSTAQTILLDAPCRVLTVKVDAAT